MKRKRGKPTKYKRKYAKMLVDYFTVDPYKETLQTVDTGKTVITKMVKVPNPMPRFDKFAEIIGVHRDTIHEWAHAENKRSKKKKMKYPDWVEAYKQAKELQKWHIAENALNNLYNPAFAIFLAKNITDLSDKAEIDHTSKGKRIKFEVINYKDVKDE